MSSERPDSPRDKFLDQFEWDGGDWLYRHTMTGPAFRVTDVEKDAFVARFDHYEKWWTRIAILIGAGMILGVIYLPPIQMPSPEGIWHGIWSFAGSLVVLIALSARHIADRFAFRSPMRSLRRRQPVAPALSKAARQQLALGRIAGKELFAGGILAAFLFVICLFVGWPKTVVGWIWLSFAGWFLVWAVVQGTRKWLLTRADYAANNLI